MEPGDDEEVERLAHAIAQEKVGSDLLDLARRIAEAEVILRRIWRARMMFSESPRQPDAYKAVESSVSKFFTEAVMRVSRRKFASL
jgi:hypothetical protein